MNAGADTGISSSDAADMLPALRFLTCGSVDDGKSTLIGRLLYEQKVVHDDHIAALERDSRKHGTTGDDVDFALLLDGLEAEREQGITIDVAYRYFASPRRAFVVVDTPGHEQYTRNMATGASNCALAVLLVDARKGLLAQTRRHAVIVRMFGIRHVVLAVNKIETVEDARHVFDDIARQFAEFAGPLEFKDVTAIPLSARDGDNVTSPSARTPWYTGATLIGHLETVDVDSEDAEHSFRLPIQWVNRPDPDFRGFAGVVASGRLAPGDEVVALPSGRTSRVASILGPGGELQAAASGDAVVVTLADEIDVARGDILAAPEDRPNVADQFEAHLIWMSDEPMMPGRSYLMKINHTMIAASVTELNYRIDTDRVGKFAAKTLELNEIGLCDLSTTRPVVFDAYADNRATGAFILIDRISNETVAAGMIDFALGRATSIPYQAITVSKAERARLKRHGPAVLWFTGLSGSGKSTIANLVEAELNARGVHTLLLDGDNVRHGLNRDLGFTEADRVENIRRTGEVAKLMTDAGLVVLCSFISPFRAERDMVRDLIGEREFIEIFVDTPLAQCIARDPKGLYRRALSGEIRNFTGIDQNYDVPEAPEMHLRTTERAAAELASDVIRDLERRKII